jgi:HSP20 family molecular chaperone IbpA
MNLKTAVAGPKTAHPDKITAAFEFSVLTLTVPGLRAENIKILCAFNQLYHFGPP